MYLNPLSAITSSVPIREEKPRHIFEKNSPESAGQSHLKVRKKVAKKSRKMPPKRGPGLAQGRLPGSVGGRAQRQFQKWHGFFFQNCNFFVSFFLSLTVWPTRRKNFSFPVFECALLVLCAFDAQVIEKRAPKDNRERRARAPSKLKLNFLS